MGLTETVLEIVAGLLDLSDDLEAVLMVSHSVDHQLEAFVHFTQEDVDEGPILQHLTLSVVVDQNAVELKNQGELFLTVQGSWGQVGHRWYLQVLPRQQHLHFNQSLQGPFPVLHQLRQTDLQLKQSLVSPSEPTLSPDLHALHFLSEDNQFLVDFPDGPENAEGLIYWRGGFAICFLNGLPQQIGTWSRASRHSLISLTARLTDPF